MCRITGYSSEMPLAPRMVRAVRQISIASRVLFSLPKDTWSGVSVPASLRRPRCRASRVPLPSSSAMSASLAWVSWKPPIGRPNCSRVTAYSRAASKQDRAAPIAPHRMPNRASLRQDSGPRRPRTSGSIADGRQPDLVEDELGGHRGTQ